MQQNPVSDWSKDFWKAFSNWLTAIKDKKIQVDSAHFRLYVAPRRTGKFAKELSDATTSEDALQAICKIKAKAKKLKKTHGCQPYLKAFLEAPIETQVAIIQRFTLVSEDDDPVEPVRKILKPTVDPASINDLCAAAIGMAKQHADHLIQCGKTAMLESQSFQSNFRALVQKILTPGLLTSLSKPPERQELECVLSERPIFVRQLEMIQVGESDRLRAVSDYLRASADKASWAERGLVFSDSLKEWDEGLVGRYHSIRGEMSELYGEKPPEARGRLEPVVNFR